MRDLPDIRHQVMLQDIRQKSGIQKKSGSSLIHMHILFIFYNLDMYQIITILLIRKRKDKEEVRG